MKKLLFVLMVVLIAAGLAIAQTDAGAQGSNSAQPAATQGTSNANQNTATTPSDQNAAQNPDQNATGQNAGQADQNATGQNAGQNAQGGRLPQTASPLPLLALLGLGSLGAGVISRKRARR